MRDEKGRFIKATTEQEWRSHPRFKNGKWSYRRFKKSACEECGSIDELHVHHKDHNRENNASENLVTLCHNCHWSHHRGNRVAWNKGKKLSPLSEEHKRKISNAVRSYYDGK